MALNHVCGGSTPSPCAKCPRDGIGRHARLRI